MRIDELVALPVGGPLVSLLLTLVFGAACVTGGACLFAMRQARTDYAGDRSLGGKRVDQERRDQVQELIDSTRLLLAHYKFRNRLIILIFSILIAVNALGLRYTGNVAEDSNQALCTFRHDLQVRAETGREFLKNNPNGAFGLTPAQIQQSLGNQEKTLVSLQSLSCDDDLAARPRVRPELGRPLRTRAGQTVPRPTREVHMEAKLIALWRANPVRIGAVIAAVVVFVAAKAGIVLDEASVSQALAIVVPVLLAGEVARAHVVPVDKLVVDPEVLPADEIDKPDETAKPKPARKPRA